MSQSVLDRVKNFLKVWSLAILIWLGVAYELHVLGSKLIQALMQYV